MAISVDKTLDHQGQTGSQGRRMRSGQGLLGRSRNRTRHMYSCKGQCVLFVKKEDALAQLPGNMLKERLGQAQIQVDPLSSL